jgi:predicted TIM-barrel fold metal-dependent hydrolase
MFLGRYGSDATGTERVDKFFYSHLFGHPFEQMIALSAIIGDTIGDDWIVFASDYSHFDSRFPGASEPIVGHPQLSDSSKRKILNDNARRLYPLD